MDQIAIIYTLFADEIEASDICRRMLQEGMIACANRLAPVTSHYSWQGQMQTEREYPVMMKTSMAQLEKAMERLRQLHSYDTPAITGWHANAAPDFAQWVTGEMSGSEKLA